MLAISSDAARLIGEIVGTSALPEGSGMRISADSVGIGEAVLKFGLTEGPTGMDDVVEHEQARVFVEREAVPYVHDKTLHAELEENRLNLVLVPTVGNSPDDPGMAL